MRTLALALLLAACSSTGGSDTPAVDAPPSDPCPTDPPTTGDPCSGSTSCLWERCPTGVTAASCVSGAWDVALTPCDAFPCEDTTCEADQLCTRREGGALLVACEPNPCGDGPIVASCACALCGDFPCTLAGRGVVCNTCTSGVCP